MLLFSRMGIAREVLTDQGSCFMSRVMKELLSLLQVKQLRTSVYHPQTDGLVERFNKTVKQMLKEAMDTDRKNWDQLLPHVPGNLGPRQGGVGEPAFSPPHHAGPCGAGEGPHWPRFGPLSETTSSEPSRPRRGSTTGEPSCASSTQQKS